MKKQTYLSIIIGFACAYALASAPVVKSPASGPDTNCQDLQGCGVYGTFVKTIDPQCCEDKPVSCTEYKVEEWKCAAGATRYRNFVYSRSLAGWNCDIAAGANCY
jgi:hypothetical protein